MAAATAVRVELLWMRRVVDDFPAALSFYRQIMRPTAVPPAGEPEPWERLGYVNLWNCSDENHMQLELVARDRFAERLGPDRPPEDALVFSADDVDAAARDLAGRGATTVVEPRDTGEGSRYAVLRDPSGMLVEFTFSSIRSFGTIDRP